MKNIRQVIRGEYVATPIQNAFNNKIAYWFSKKDCILAIYMFTVYSYESEKEFEERLSENGFNEFIPMFEERRQRPYNVETYNKERMKLQ